MERMESGIFIALIALVSGLVGAWVQHALTQRREADRSLDQLRNEAYIAFIKAMSGLAVARRSNDRLRELDFTIMLVEAKARVIIYGDSSVIDSMAAASRHAALTSPEATHSVIELVKVMRQHSQARSQDVSSEAISLLLIGGAPR